MGVCSRQAYDVPVESGRGGAWERLPEHLGLHVTLGDVPDELPGADHPLPGVQITQGAMLVRFTHGARILVRDGHEVTVQFDPESDPDGDPSWLLHGWAVPLAAMQRGELTLHAATLRIGEAVVAIAGRPGAGKSTTAVGLNSRGHQLFTDDVALLEFRGDEAWITPFASNIHLLSDAAEALGIDFSALPPLALGRDKAAFRTDEPAIDPLRLDLIVVLDPDREPGDSDGGPHGQPHVGGLDAQADILDPSHGLDLLGIDVAFTGDEDGILGLVCLFVLYREPPPHDNGAHDVKHII